ncbi:MAG: heparinase II/III family protein, partial [Oscillospiraceae bacterium]
MWCIKDILADDVTLEKLYENMTTRVLSRRDMKKRAQQINCIFPEIAVAVKTEAEDSLKGLLLLPGSSKKSFVGNPPKWRQNPYGNEEYVYELNRMKHWLTLLEAYELTGEVKFCQKVKAEFEDWFATCACPDYSLEKYRGDGPWRLLEVGIRGYLVLPLVFEYLIESQQMDINLFEKLIVSAWQHCTILYKFTLIFWPDSDHNHATMENLGLLALSSLIPEFKLAKIWQAHGLKELTRCIQNQVTLDGGQIEGSPSYHNGSVYWFSLVVTFSQKYDFAVDKSYVKLLKKMFEYSVYGTRPCGGNTPWGDCHTHIETMALAAVSCYIAFKDITYLQYAFNFYSKEAVFKELSENIWFISDIKKLDEDLKKVEQETFSIDLPKMSWQRELKQVFMRTGWSKDAISLMFSCRSPIQNGHAHMDVGGF